MISNEPYAQEPYTVHGKLDRDVYDAAQEEEDVWRCASCGDDMEPEDEQHYSYTLDTYQCLGCHQDGDNP